MVKSTSYNQLNSSKGNKSKSKDKLVEKNITFNQLNGMLHNYTDDTYNYLHVKDVEPKNIKVKGNKTTKSPHSKHQKKSSYKLNMIYKQLCERIKILQISSQELYEKHRKFKETKQKQEAEFAKKEKSLQEREQKLAEREAQLQHKERQLSMREHEVTNNQNIDMRHSLRSSDEFDFKASSDYNHIIQQLRSIDTKSPHGEMNMFNHPNDGKLHARPVSQEPQDMYDEYHPDDESPLNLVKSLEKHEFSPGKLAKNKKPQNDMAEVATYMSNKVDNGIDKITQAQVSQISNSCQVNLITQEEIEEVKQIKEEYESFQVQKAEFETQRQNDLTKIQKEKELVEQKQGEVKRQMDKITQNEEDLKQREKKLEAITRKF